MKVFNGLITRRFYRGCALIELEGEFDVSQVTKLQSTLSGVFDTMGFAFVDFSRVTFIDSKCLTEITVYHQLHAGRLLLCRPSQQVRVGADACGLAGWLTFHPDEKSALQSIVKNSTTMNCREQGRPPAEEEGGYVL